MGKGPLFKTSTQRSHAEVQATNFDMNKMEQSSILFSLAGESRFAKIRKSRFSKKETLISKETEVELTGMNNMENSIEDCTNPAAAPSLVFGIPHQ
jgi:hypothetical protein